MASTRSASHHADDRGEDAIYRNLIGEITEQFPPRDMLEAYLVQSIAYATIIERRLRRANELKMMPKKGPVLSEAKLQEAALRRELQELITLNRETYNSIDNGALPGLSAVAAAKLAAACHVAVADSQEAKEEAERRALQASGKADEEPEDNIDHEEEDNYRPEGRVKYDPATAAEVVTRRLGDTRRSLDSYIPELIELKPPDAPPQEEELWEDDELLAAVTVYDAILPVAKEFATPEAIGKSLQNMTRLTPQRRTAWLEVLRCVYHQTVLKTPGPAPEPGEHLTEVADPVDLTPQDLADETLRELLADLDGFSKLQRLERDLERRIQKGLRQLRRDR